MNNKAMSLEGDPASIAINWNDKGTKRSVFAKASADAAA